MPHLTPTSSPAPYAGTPHASVLLLILETTFHAHIER
jgi:hypothetical protein